MTTLQLSSKLNVFACSPVESTILLSHKKTSEKLALNFSLGVLQPGVWTLCAFVDSQCSALGCEAVVSNLQYGLRLWYPLAWRDLPR